MKKADMRCSRCINFEDGHCHLEPFAFKVVCPESHWCSKGVWLLWSDRFLDFEQHYWGEWEASVRPDLMSLN